MNKGKLIIILFSVIAAIVIGIVCRNNEEEMPQRKDIVETKIVLYFSDPKTGELAKEYRYVELENIKNDISATIINELLEGPENEELVSEIPEGTKVNSVVIDGGKVIVDFSNEFVLESEDELKNLHKIYSVVNSITEITEINEVEIKVDGKTLTSKVRL